MALSDTNLIVISGRLTSDPTPRGGGSVAAFSVASNRYYRDKGGNSVEEVCFIDVTAFGFEAKAVLENLIKGAPVQVEGRLELNRYQNGEGEKRQNHRIVANRVTSPALRSKPAATPQAEEKPAEAEEAELVGATAGDDDIPF